MPKYLIERDLPSAGKLTPDQLRDISAKSCDVLRTLGADIQWVQSYVSADRITCVYIARDEAIIREHASRGGFPVTRITEVVATIDPMTAEMKAAAQSR